MINADMEKRIESTIRQDQGDMGSPLTIEPPESD